MQKVQKQKSDLQRLKQIYKNWQDFISKSRVKMKKKVKKDKKEYYDFDYTRGQYYYNYPQNHINFASPDTQLAFFKDVLTQQTKSVSNLYDSHFTSNITVQSDLKPQELHDFLRQIRGKLHKVIVDLRIQKSLYIREGKAKEELLDLMEDQIRSYHHRLVRLHQVFFHFQKSLSQRLEERTTTLKLKKFDQMHFSELQKGDFVIFLRMEGVEQRLSIQLNRFVDEFQIQLYHRKSNIYKRCYEKRGAKGKIIQNHYGEQYQRQKAKIQRYFIDNEPTFFDSEDKLKQLQVFLTNLNYTKCINNHRPYLDSNMCIQEVDYIPSSQSQLKQSLMSVCKNYFPNQMLQSLYTHKKQHLCYRLNYFSSIILRTIAQTYSFLIQIKQKDIHSMKNTMKRQLQTIFTNEADKLFNVAEHQIIFLVDEGSYQLDFIKYKGADQQENIFREYFNVNHMIDTFAKSIINILSVTQEKAIKDVVDAYVLQVCESSSNKLKYLSLFFANYNNDDKLHTINLLNSKMIIGAFKQNVLQSKFIRILNQSNVIDEGLLKITYLLYAINNIQVRKQLDHVINAQISILYKVKYRLSLLKHNHQMPFQMMPEFLQRFTESSFTHQFVNNTENLNTKSFTLQENHDRIFWIKKGQNRQSVQIRRIIPQNPLFEGKKVLYREALKETDVILQKIHNIIAYLVEKRQNYLQEHSFSGIVDRFRIVNKLLNLQVQYHCKKLKYMEEVFEIFEKSNSHEGIFIATDLLYSAKRKQVYYSLNQPHFEQKYINQTQLWQKKAELLSLLKKKQMLLQQQQKKRFRESLLRSNHVNNVPQISSIYYSDELAMDGDDNIAEDDQQDALSEDVSQSQFMMNSSKYKSDLSAISSEYHVKTTFKQILGRSSVNAQAAEQNKREELMGRKKKKILNDSVLGGILLYQGCNYYRYLHKVLQADRSFQKLYEAQFTDKDVGVKRQYYEEVINVIRQSDERITLQPCLVEQNLLNKYLADCNRAISKVIQKSKFNSAGLDDYLFFSSKLFKDILDNSTFSNLNQLRGLYTCLNMIKLSKIFPKFLRNKLVYKGLIEKIKSLSKQHSGQAFSRDYQFFTLQILSKQFQIGPFLKFIDNPNQFSAYKSIMFLANNTNLCIASFTLFNNVVQYYKNIAKNQCQEIFDYRTFLDNLMMMQNYGSYFDKTILGVKGIQNRLYIRRKIQSLTERLKQVTNRKNLQEFLSLPIKVISAMKKFDKKNVENESHVLQNIKSFEQFIEQVGAASAIISIITQKIIVKQNEKKLILYLQNAMKILPFCGKLVYVQPISQSIYRQFFHEDFKISTNHSLGESDKKLVFEYRRLIYDQLARNATRDHLFSIRPFVKVLMQRKYKQFNGNRQTLQKYYDYMDTFRLQESYSFSMQGQLRDIYNYKKDMNKMSNLKTWIECKLLFFGVSLSQHQLLCFRSVLKDIHENSEVFFRDQSNKLINYQDLVKMKVEMVDGSGIIDRYKKKFLIYQNLKSKYKVFLDILTEMNFANQGREIINVIYIGEKDVFLNSHKVIPNYLKQYCFQPKIKNQTTKFVDFITESNPNRYMHNNFFSPITFNNLKSSIWRSQNINQFKERTSFIEQRCQIIKNTLNSSNTKMRDMTQQLVVIQFTRERMKDLFQYLQIPVNKKSKVQYAFFLKKLQEKLLLGMEKLNPFQKFVSKFIEKILKEKPQLFGLKDQIFQKIYEAKFYQNLIEHKLLNLSIQTLSKQLTLYSILTQNYQQKQLIRENRIIKNTLNKVLVPKIIINPYLQSPLILQNYFFAASLKLSYIDSFLNKLKNRAIFVELAEGGFGFLLKITELDQCIQSLCKGVITFTEKEFNDRFRTFIESHEELRQKYRKANNQNQNLRNIVELCKQQWGKQIKSTIYSKLNSYLSTIHTKQKTYQSIFQTIKSLQIQIAKRFDEKYEKRIKTLQQQNKRLNDRFIQYKQITTKNSRTSMQQSKDYLYNSFKKEVQGILNKQIIKEYSETVNKDHQQQQQYTSTLLLKKLRTQKIFYEIRVANLQGKVKQKTNDIIKLKDEITRLDNTLTLQQYKTTKLADEIKRLFDKNIEIEDLKREIVKKEEEQAMSKFKLIKINEHLQGKLGRIEEKNKSESMISVKQTKRQERNMAIQAGGSEKKQRRNFKIRTEHSQPIQPIQSYNRAEEIVLWKQKWELSERKYQILMSKLVQSYQVYRMNKNYIKLAQKIGNIFEQCTSNHLIKRQ